MALSYEFHHSMLFFQSFMDIQFPNGQLTYVAGEGITSSAFFPILGGLLQAQCAHPDVIKLSFSKKVSCYIDVNLKRVQV